MLRYGAGPGEVDPRELATIRDYMIKRGPDGAGLWYSHDRRAALGHRRLAIIGLGDQGRQPMELVNRCHRAGGSVTISYNGEIYNYRELRRDLVARGHQLSGVSDTEVLLHLYEESGPSFVGALQGMYAFVLWDSQNSSMVLARDPLGIKPLYFADDGTTLRVASQARALLAGGLVSRNTSDAALAGLLILGSVPEPRTAWTAIEALPAGATMTVRRDGSRAFEQCFSLAGALACVERNEMGDDPDAALQSSVAESIQAHLLADVDVGVFLSAGIDSSSILGLSAQGGRRMRAVTLGFEEYAGSPDDEVPLATIVAGQYGAEHTVGSLRRSDFVSYLPLILAGMDQPTVDGLNTWMVSRLAASSGLKVALSGIGGDEFLGGYSSFLSVPKWNRRLRVPAGVPGLGRAARALLLPPLRSRYPKVPGVIEYSDTLVRGWLLRRSVQMPWELGSVIGHDRAAAALNDLSIDEVLNAAVVGGPKSDVGLIAALEGGLYMRNQLLRDADWAGMAHSLEIRVPLVDVRLLPAMAGPLLQRWVPPEGKQVLGRAAAPTLPPTVRSRPKTGFSVPIGRWLTEMRDFDAWRRVPVLAHPRCSWSRRWAYSIADAFDMI